MRAAIYARVSTANLKDGRCQSPEAQLRDLRDYCYRHGLTIIGEYIDAGISGAKESRPELDRLMADARDKKFDTVIVFRFDRFARSVSHLLRALEQFNSLGISFVSFSEQMDTSTPTGKMIFTVLGAVAELERTLIIERVRSGMRNAKARGKKIGRAQTAVDMARYRELRSQGESLRSCARQMNVPVTTLHNHVRVA